jgi:hypothetical protein
MVQYLLDAGEQPLIPGVEAPRTEFADVSSRSCSRSSRSGAYRARSAPSPGSKSKATYVG